MINIDQFSNPSYNKPKFIITQEQAKEIETTIHHKYKVPRFNRRSKLYLTPEEAKTIQTTTATVQNMTQPERIKQLLRQLHSRIKHF